MHAEAEKCCASRSALAGFWLGMPDSHSREAAIGATGEAQARADVTISIAIDTTCIFRWNAIPE